MFYLTKRSLSSQSQLFVFSLLITGAISIQMSRGVLVSLPSISILGVIPVVSCSVHLYAIMT